MFDPKKFNTSEYVKQIILAVKTDPEAVQLLLEEYGAKAYRQARQDGAAAMADMFSRS